MQGLALRDLPLPVDTVIVSIRRQGHLLLSHGYTRLELGDEVTRLVRLGFSGSSPSELTDYSVGVFVDALTDPQ